MKNDNYILGLNAYGFNTSATLLKNGILIGAIEEERLSREKRTRKFPINSIKYLLNLE
jgi:predicted NodU family carbamoyl transferase